MDERWTSLVAAARTMMAERQPATYSQFGLDYSMQYEWNLDRAEVVFSSKGKAIVRADLQFLGSITGPGGTWLWGWANESIPAAATNRLAAIRCYGEEQGYSKLAEGEWAPQGDDGRDVMVVSACILDAPAFFHDHHQNLALYFVLDGFEHIAGRAAVRSYRRLFED